MDDTGENVDRGSIGMCPVEATASKWPPGETGEGKQGEEQHAQKSVDSVRGR